MLAKTMCAAVCAATWLAVAITKANAASAASGTSGGRSLLRVHERHQNHLAGDSTIGEDFPSYLPISALRDALEQKVIINALMTQDFVAELELCLFSADQAGAESLTRLKPINVKPYSYAQQGDWTEHRIECPLPANGVPQAWVDVQVQGGVRGKHPVEIEDLTKERSPHAALCGPSVYSNQAWLPDFVAHYEGLGVDEFHFYLPEGPVLEAFLKEPTADFDGVYTQIAGSLSSKRALPYEHPAVKWHNFTTSPGGRSFNQRAGFTDCISRLSYSHKYAVIADLDEFFHLTKRAAITSVTALMDKYLPPSAAGLAFMDIHYPRDCPTRQMGFDKVMMPFAWSGLFADSYTLHFRAEVPESHAATYGLAQMAIQDLDLHKPKSIVRVEDIFSVNGHGPEILKDPAKQHTWTLPHYLAHFKHIRYTGPTICAFGTAVGKDNLIRDEAVLHWMEP